MSLTSPTWPDPTLALGEGGVRLTVSAGLWLRITGVGLVAPAGASRHRRSVRCARPAVAGVVRPVG